MYRKVAVDIAIPLLIVTLAIAGCGKGREPKTGESKIQAYEAQQKATEKTLIKRITHGKGQNKVKLENDVLH